MESASSRVIATNGAALRIAEGGTGEPALVFLHYWGGSPICRSRGGGMMSVAVPLDRLEERGESRKENEESQATGWRLSTRGFLLSTFSPLLSICRRQIGATGFEPAALTVTLLAGLSRNPPLPSRSRTDCLPGRNGRP